MSPSTPPPMSPIQNITHSPKCLQRLPQNSILDMQYIQVEITDNIHKIKTHKRPK